MLRQSLERSLPYDAEQLFDIAADVERYPEFLRWWVAARVREVEPNGYCTDQVLGLGPLRTRFTSKTRLERPTRIDVISGDSAFRRFSLSWTFEPLAAGGCLVRLSVDLELRSRLLQVILDRAMPDTTGETMAAFEARAHRLCGPPLSKSR